MIQCSTIHVLLDNLCIFYIITSDILAILLASFLLLGNKKCVQAMASLCRSFTLTFSALRTSHIAKMKTQIKGSKQLNTLSIIPLTMCIVTIPGTIPLNLPVVWLHSQGLGEHPPSPTHTLPQQQPRIALTETAVHHSARVIYILIHAAYIEVAVFCSCRDCLQVF